MDNSHCSSFDTTVEIPYAEIVAAKRSIEARVENPVDAPHPTENLPDGPEIEDPTETEDPQKAATGRSSGKRAWN